MSASTYGMVASTAIPDMAPLIPAGSLADSALQHPPCHGLVVVQWSGYGHVGLEIFEAGLLHRAVGTDIERVRLVEETLQIERLDVNVGASLDACGTDAALPQLQLGHVQMHVCMAADVDLVAAGNPTARPSSSHTT